jgi:uroporphyrinogen-III synthase
MAHASFDGLRVLSLESRRAKEIAKLIKTYGGEPFVVPAMREVPLESNRQALEFADNLMLGKFDLVVFLTGVGVRALLDIIQTRYDREEFLQALRSVRIAARGPKPQAVLRELNVPIAAIAEEPNTWREMMQALDDEFGASLSGFRVAVQEYGVSNPEFLQALTERCSEVTRVPVYQWALPEDLQPLRECVLGIASGGVDVVLFMTAVQVIHLFQVAEQMSCQDDLRAGLMAMVVVSIGPTTSEELARYGITPDFEPSHPKMGFLVNEAAQYAGKMLEQKRSGEARSLMSRQVGLRVVKGKGEEQRAAIAAERVRRVAASTSTAASWADADRFPA